jgi:dihydropteroate synthase
MGIINATPDSFYKGDIHKDILWMAEKMVADGAAIIDIGGQSTRPGSVRINENEEMDRIIPWIKKIHEHFPDAVISVDTFYSKVALEAVNQGASMVNDISAGGMDENMIHTVASLKVPYICMHMKGKPDNMQQHPVYSNVLKEVLDFFIGKIDQCKKAGIVDIIIDPGFGFGKTIEHNFQLLHNLDVFNILDKPILAGLSRKSTIYKTLQTTPDKALNGTSVLNTIALLNGATILRVHDVQEAMEAITLYNAYKKTPPVN